MNENKRWTMFIILSMMIMLFYSIQTAKQKAEFDRAQAAKRAAEAALAGEATPEAGTDLTAASAGAVTASNDAATTAPSQVAAPAATSAAETAAREEKLLQTWKEAPLVTVHNDRVRVVFSAFGGRVESWKILDPRYSLTYKHAVAESNEPLDPVDFGEEMVLDFPGQQGVPRRPFELSIVANARPYKELNNVIWEMEHEEKEGGTHLVKMTSPEVGGLRVIKTFELQEGNLQGMVRLKIENRSASAMRFDNGGLGVGLVAWGPGVGTWHKKTDTFDFSSVLGFTGSILEVGQKQLPYDSAVENLRWIGVADKYLLAGAIATAQSDYAGTRVTLPIGAKVVPSYPAPYIVEVFGKPFTLGAGETSNIEYGVFVSPKAPAALKEIGKDQHLPRALFYSSWGWFRALCLGMLWMLSFFHGIFSSWGVSIIALTIFMKLLTHPINHKALKINAEFQREMARIKPEMDALAAKHKDDPQQKMLAQQQLMREHKINPFAPLRGCVPMLLQVPIFFALYRILGQSIDLRGEPFLWINDLAAADALVPNLLFGLHLNVLPLLMVVTQIIAMQLSSKATSMDPSQKMMLYVLPVVMLATLYTFPSGLFLYWVAQNCWQIGHTLLTNRQVEQAHAVEDQMHAVEVVNSPATSARERRRQAGKK